MRRMIRTMALLVVSLSMVGPVVAGEQPVYPIIESETVADVSDLKHGKCCIERTPSGMSLGACLGVV